MHTEGYAAPATKEAAQRAHRLIEEAQARGEAPEDPLLLFSVLYAVWVANRVSFDGEAMRDLATQYLALAKKLNATAPLMIGHRLKAISLMCIGDIAGSRPHYDQALALYKPDEHRQLAMRFGQDHRPPTLTHRALAMWLLGYPDAALADIEQALSDARQLGQAAGLMSALYHAWFTVLLCGNYNQARALAHEFSFLADEKNLAGWHAPAKMQEGVLLGLTCQPTEAIHRISAGMTHFRSTGGTAWEPFFLTNLQYDISQPLTTQ